MKPSEANYMIKVGLEEILYDVKHKCGIKEKKVCEGRGDDVFYKNILGRRVLVQRPPKNSLAF